MTPHQIARIVRTLRHRQQLTQQALGERAGVSRGPVQRIEAGDVEQSSTATLRSVVEALGARLEITVSWRGADLDRVLDEGHARLVAAVLGRLSRWNWSTEIEVSFSHYGDRGSIDIFGWHAQAATLVVIEIKTELGSVEGLLRPLDVKVRLAPALGAERFGWRAARVARLVVFPDHPTVRRHVQRHAGVLDAALPARSREVTSWLRAPAGTLRGMWFLSDAGSTRTTLNPSSRRRVRPPRITATQRGAGRIDA